MDSADLEKISQSKFELHTVKKNLKEKLSQQLIFVYESSFFKATPEFIAFLSVWDSETIVVEDLHGNPVTVNRQDLLVRSKDCYHRASSEWFSGYSDLKNN